jgi:hypothetical protein
MLIPASRGLTPPPLVDCLRCQLRQAQEVRCGYCQLRLPINVPYLGPAEAIRWLDAEEEDLLADIAADGPINMLRLTAWVQWRHFVLPEPTLEQWVRRRIADGLLVQGPGSAGQMVAASLKGLSRAGFPVSASEWQALIRTILDPNILGKGWDN